MSAGLHRVLVLFILPVGVVHTGLQIGRIELVVGRLYQELRVLVLLVGIGDDLLAGKQKHLRLHHSLHLIEPPGLFLVGKGVRLDLVHRLYHL